MTTATRGEDSIWIAAAPRIVYDVISDVPRMGERSPECYRCEWLDGAAAAAVGARFRGYNRLGLLRWSTTSTVVAADPGREFAFTVMSRGGREETRWRYVMEERDGGTLLSESYEFVWCPAVARVAEIPFPRDRQLRRGVRQTLLAAKAAAEALRSAS